LKQVNNYTRNQKRGGKTVKVTHRFYTSLDITGQLYARQQAREYDKLVDCILDGGYIPDPKSLRVDYKAYMKDVMEVILTLEGTK
jgi:hypothetical protein